MVIFLTNGTIGQGFFDDRYLFVYIGHVWSKSKLINTTLTDDSLQRVLRCHDHAAEFGYGSYPVCFSSISGSFGLAMGILSRSVSSKYEP